MISITHYFERSAIY